MTGQLMKGKRGLVMGVANDHSIAWGIAQTLHAHGAEMAFTYQDEAFGKRLRPLAESIGAKHVMQCDASKEADLDRVFAQPTLADIVAAAQSEPGEFAAGIVKALAQRSPLMMAVTLEQVRRARGMTLADELRMERDMVHHCFHLRPLADGETVEGIRALAVDKDHAPRWKPATVAEVEPAEVQAFFRSPWPADRHPLSALA